MSLILILPWFSIAESEHFDEFDLLPYRRGHLPKGLDRATRDGLDEVASRFYVRISAPIETATLIKLCQRDLIFEPTEEEVDFIGALSELLALGGLSYREFFSGGTLYSNKQTFQVHLQPVDAIAVNVRSRRRDGETVNIVPAAHYRIQKPEEVVADSQRRLDSALIRALLAAMPKSPSWHQIIEAIVCFNLANGTV